MTVKEKHRRRTGCFPNTLLKVRSTAQPHQHHLGTCRGTEPQTTPELLHKKLHLSTAGESYALKMWSTALHTVNHLHIQTISLRSFQSSHVNRYGREEVLRNLDRNKDKKWLRGMLGMFEGKKLHAFFAKEKLWAPAFVVEAKGNVIQLYNFK